MRHLGIDRACQSEKECGSDGGLEEHWHFNNEWMLEWMEVRRMAVGSTRDRLCEMRPLIMRD